MRLLTLARDLRRRKARERDGLFVVEGIRVVEELVRSPLEVVGLLCAQQLTESARGVQLRSGAAARGTRIDEVTDREFASAAETESPQGLLAVARIPVRTLDAIRWDAPALRLLVLDAVQDPGNVGTIVRTAAALGADATLALPGTVDLWNAKVVRSAMGAHFHHHAQHATWDDVRSRCAHAHVELWGADLGGTPLGERPHPSRVALVLGNEGSGLTPALRGDLRRLVSLPITPLVESLNVAVAAGIFLHELRP